MISNTQTRLVERPVTGPMASVMRMRDNLLSGGSHVPIEQIVSLNDRSAGKNIVRV